MSRSLLGRGFANSLGWCCQTSQLFGWFYLQGQQRKPRDASSTRLNERVNPGPDVVLRPGAVPEPVATQLDGEDDTRVAESQEDSAQAAVSVSGPSKRQSWPSQQSQKT